VITNPAGAHCTFEIKFIGDFYKEVKSGDRIIILYTAKLNEDAVYTNEGNKNELWLNYGNDSETTHDSTTTKTYGFDLVKTTTDGDLLPGAKFKIYTAATGGDAIQFVKLSTTTDGKNYDIYRLATADEIADASVTKYTEMEVTKGAIRIFGLDKSHYYLEETVAPENYNKLKERKEISLEFSNFLAFDTNDKPLTNTGFQVINQSGSILPETGAAGTTAFITMGMILVLGAGMLLITKKRMAMIQD
jgi:LPXTG-motif cell wall-anchored protein